MKKTMKIAMAVALLFTATLSAHAQFSAKSSDRVPDRFHMGLRAGFTINSYTGDYTSNIDPLLFPTGGFALDFQVAPVPIFVGLGLNYVNLGYKWDSKYDSETEHLHCIHLPLTASYHINVAPNLFINPFFGGFVAYNLTDIDKDEKDWDDNRLNYGLRFGCGMNYGRLTLDMGYDLGLKNAYDSSDYKATSGTFFMTIGINWAGDR